MKPLYSIELHLPEDIGYYAEISKEIADIATLVDRHKTLLWVSHAGDADAIENFVQQYKVNCEKGIWLQLDEYWSLNERIFTDYGIITQEGNRYLDLALGAIVILSGRTPDAEMLQALEQADEHAIAHQTQDGRQLIAVDRHHVELLEGIAKAYHCHAEALQFVPETF